MVVDPLDIVVDVGGVYDPSRHRYDHHQRGFTEVFGHGGFDKIKLSSAGLVYKSALSVSVAKMKLILADILESRSSLSSWE